MEIRKVQVTGGSSYIISLPKSWINSLGIKKNDPLKLTVQPDMSLLILPPLAKLGKEKYSSKTFHVEDFHNENFLLRSMIGAYISGYREINIISNNNNIPSTIRDVATKFSRMVIGQEIIEEAPKKIVIKDILDPAELPFEKVLRRMHIITRSMYEDSLNSLKNKDKNIAEDVIQRDSEIDRLHWLIARHQTLVSRDPSLTNKMNIELGACMIYFQISKIIERIGDHVSRIALFGTKIYGDLNEDLTNTIVSSGKYALQLFDSSFDSYKKGTPEQAQRTLEKIELLKKDCENINSRALGLNSDSAIAIGYIAESIRRTGEYSGDLCEYIIDYFI